MSIWQGVYSPEEFYEKTISLKSYPSFKNLISMQLDFFEWWKNANTDFIIRGYKRYPRARIYKNNNERFLSSDNEACVSFYTYTYDKGGYNFQGDLFRFYKKQRLQVSFPVDKKKLYDEESFISNAKDENFKIGGATGIPFRENHELKLSHYVDAADNLSTKTTAKKRCGIFLSPLNIILTPKTKRKFSGYIHTLKKEEQKIGLTRNDIGETRETLNILHSYLIRDIINQVDGEKAYRSYCEICDLDFKKQISLIKKNTSNTLNYKFEFIKPFKKEKEKKEKKLVRAFNKNISPNINNDFLSINSTRFYITQSIYEDLISHPKKSLKIIIVPKKGNHPKGYYLMSNTIAKEFIESKQGSNNWHNHQNFKQDVIPRDLAPYFKYEI